MRNQDNPPQKNRFDRSGPYPRAALLSDVRSSARTPANMECCHLARLLQSPPMASSCRRRAVQQFQAVPCLDPLGTAERLADRKSGVSGKRVAVRVGFGGGRVNK